MRRITILLATAAALMLVPAANAFAEGTITVHIEGTGSGEVAGYGIFTGNPPVACTYASPGPEEGNCHTELTYSSFFGDEGLTIEAIAAEGSEFVEWTNVSQMLVEGEACPSEPGDPHCALFATGNTEPELEATAVFNEEPEPTFWSLTASKSGSGNGWLHSEAPAYAINCGGPCTSKTASFEEGTVTLTASGSQFAGWESCPGTEAGRVCEVSLTADMSAVAEFVANHALTVSKTGTGNGWIHSESPAYTINCGGPCTTKTGFFTQASVTLTASGSEFQEWTSCPGTASGRECTVSLSEDKSAEAKFE